MLVLVLFSVECGQRALVGAGVGLKELHRRDGLILCVCACVCVDAAVGKDSWADVTVESMCGCRLHGLAV